MLCRTDKTLFSIYQSPSAKSDRYPELLVFCGAATVGGFGRFAKKFFFFENFHKEAGDRLLKKSLRIKRNLVTCNVNICG